MKDIQNNSKANFINKIGDHGVNSHGVNSNAFSLIGGKAASLIELHAGRIPIPGGFVINTLAYDLFIERNNLTKIIKRIFSQRSKKQVLLFADIVRESILKSPVPEELIEEINSYVRRFNFRSYAVRSSSNVEDTKEESWAGKFESYLHIPPGGIVAAVKRCWASVFNRRVIDYTAHKLLPIKMAVIVQENIDSNVAGVCFTRNPLDQEDGTIQIEAVFGLGELLVQGEIIPDSYKVEPVSNIILEVDVCEQGVICKVMQHGGTELVSIKKTSKQKLSGKEIIQLADIAQKIERIQGHGRDIEWCKRDNKFYILQSRPITTGFNASTK